MGEGGTKIYLIVGETGEYSSRREWYVCAFRDKDAAEAFAQSCRDFVAEHLEPRSQGGCNFYESRHTGCEHEGGPDPQIEVSYTGTSYTVAEVELR